MAQIAKAPAAIWAAVSILVLQLMLLLAAGYLDLPVVQAALVLLFALLLVLGSRVGWTLLLLGAGVDAIARFSGQEPTWMLGLDCVLLVALILPSSRQFVWRDRPPRRFSLPRLPYGVIAWRLGFGLMTLLVLSGVVEIWEEGSGKESSAVRVLADVTNLIFSAVLLAFIVSFGGWAYGAYGRSAQGQAKQELTDRASYGTRPDR